MQRIEISGNRIASGEACWVLATASRSPMRQVEVSGNLCESSRSEGIVLGRGAVHARGHGVVVRDNVIRGTRPWSGADAYGGTNHQGAPP